MSTVNLPTSGAASGAAYPYFPAAEVVLPQQAQTQTQQAPARETAPVAKEKEIDFQNPQDREKQLEQLNRIMQDLGTRLEFGLYEDSGQFYVQMIDRSKNRVVKMMPPEWLLDLRSKIRDAVGLILDERQ